MENHSQNKRIFILGGVREALFSDHNYNLEWGKRLGFAKVAIDAKVVSLKKFRSIKIFFKIFDITKKACDSNVYSKL